jgi:FtsH-binding integral membrane protein
MTNNFEVENVIPTPEEPQTPPVQPVQLPNENVLAGIVGAFLFSLAGGIIWFLLYQVGILAAFSGLIGVVCAIKGYAIFGKRESTKGIIISTVIAFIVLVLAWYLCLSYDVYDAYQLWYEEGHVDFTLTFFESVRAVPYFFEDKEILIPYLKDLGIGLLFAALGVVYYLSRREKKMKKQAAEAALAEEKTKESAEEAKTDTNAE